MEIRIIVTGNMIMGNGRYGNNNNGNCLDVQVQIHISRGDLEIIRLDDEGDVEI